MVVGLDASARDDRLRPSKLQVEEFGNLRFQQGDAQSLDLNEQFDWVISFACLHWVIILSQFLYPERIGFFIKDVIRQGFTDIKTVNRVVLFRLASRQQSNATYYTASN